MVKNGIFKENDGSFVYYENDEPNYKGVFKAYGNFYYANSNGHLNSGSKVYLVRYNNLLDRGFYQIDKESRVLNADGSIMTYEVKNGLWQSPDNDELYYLKNGVPVKNTKVEVDGYLYLTDDKGQLYRDGEYKSYKFDYFGRATKVQNLYNSVFVNSDEINSVWINGVCVWSKN